ncbi:MAG: helix-turn-helix transcriptional regulator [Enterocloster asparagiformis]|nr:helix-turn-helix transcriptional regulator [Enterocloster asparagiformis]
MNSVERVKQLCKDRKIPISKLEKDLGYSNGYISQLRKGVFPSDRLASIAEYLNVSTDFIMSGIEEAEEPQLTARDRRDIAKDLDRIMNEMAAGEDAPLCYNGEPIPEAKLELLRQAIEVALEDAKKKNKVTYRPYKYKPRPQKD